MYKSLDDISISREKSAKVILVSHSSVAASIIFTIFLVKSSKPNTVQCSLLLAAAEWLSKESGNQEKKDTRLSTILVSDQTKRREKMMIKMKLIRKLRRLLVH